MSQTGIQRTYKPGTNNLNTAAGPVPQGATVPIPSAGGGQWSPTVANLLVLVVLEVVAFAALRYAFRIVAK